MILLLRLLELATLSLQRPEELPQNVKSDPLTNLQRLILFGLPALSVSVGTYLVRDSYQGTFVFFLLLHGIMETALFYFYARLSSSVIEARMQAVQSARSGRATELFDVVSASLLPFLFVAPIASIARVTPSPRLVASVTTTLLLFWSFYIMLRSVQYLYEIPTRAAARTVAFSIISLTALPLLAFLVLTIRFLGASN